VTDLPAMTVTEKVLARAAGRAQVRPGDEVWADADRMIMNDSSGPRRIAGLVDELGGVADPDRVVLVSDHFVPAATVTQAAILRATRTWAGDHRIGTFHEYDGILHSLVVERELADAGMLVVGADSHTTSAGAVGAVAVAVGSTELATVLATGQVWLRVPETIRIELTGSLPPRVAMRDLTLRILGDHGSSFALYAAIEYGGDLTCRLDVWSRMVLANQGIEMGAKNAVVVAPTGPVPDPDAAYSRRLAYDAGQLEPLVAVHPAPDRVERAAALANESVDMAWIGSCVGGRNDDLRAAAAVLRGRSVAVPTLVTPSTRRIYEQALADGTIATLAGAGATILPPGCGACAGIHAGVQGDGDRVIATATRNFPGRMGSRDARVFLASAYTVAASALTGRITDPRRIGAASSEEHA
jgi:3-isopropylmalate/(R)-2-methylmalate dehydratase large subunit